MSRSSVTGSAVTKRWGEKVDRDDPKKLKTHGYRAKSVFRRGLESLHRMLRYPIKFATQLAEFFDLIIRQTIFKNYLDKQTQLCALLKTKGARVALLTPQPIEEKRPDPDKDVRNEALRKMSDGLRDVAAEQGVLFVDQFDPYMAVMLKARQGDPNALIGGGDAVHPGPVGHTVMAWAILKSLGASGAVSSVELNGATGKIVAATGCQITELNTAEDGVSFTRLDDTLPAPFDPAAEKVTELIPVLADLSRYELKVTGLLSANYQLLIDDKLAATLTAKELAEGCNLTLVSEIRLSVQRMPSFIGSPAICPAMIFSRTSKLSG